MLALVAFMRPATITFRIASAILAARMRASGRGDSMARYWVLGGVHADTAFAPIAGGGEESRIGPVAGDAAAGPEWRRLAWSTADDALARFRIGRRAGGPGAGKPERSA
jgi:hypothetical protein